MRIYKFSKSQTTIDRNQLFLYISNEKFRKQENSIQNSTRKDLVFSKFNKRSIRFVGLLGGIVN